MRRLRHQLPAYSPLRGSQIARALLTRKPPGDVAARLMARYGADEIRLCGSGTQALQLAMTEAARRSGADAVALPAYGCYDLASAAVGAGLRVTLYDIDATTLSPDLNSLERAIDGGGGVVVAAALYGVPIRWDEVSALCDIRGAALIEDAAQGVGASWQERPLGSLGRLSVVSFGRGKGWTAGGGGALLARGAPLRFTAEMPDSRTSVRSAAVTGAQWVLGRPSLYGIPAGIPALGLGATEYHPPSRPIKMSAFNLTLLSLTWDDAEREGAIRRANAALLIDALREGPFHVFHAPDSSRAGYLRFPLLIPADAHRFIPDARRLGVAPPYPMTLARLAALRGCSFGNDTFPGAETLVRQLITLPSHSLLRPSDLDALRRFIASRWKL